MLRSNVLQCGWTQNQILHSNACQPMAKWYSPIWYPLYKNLFSLAYENSRAAKNDSRRDQNSESSIEILDNRFLVAIKIENTWLTPATTKITVAIATNKSELTSLNNYCWTAASRVSAWAFFGHNFRNRSYFLQADRITYFPQHIKKLELAGVGTAIKFLHGGVLWKFENGVCENFRFSA